MAENRSNIQSIDGGDYTSNGLLGGTNLIVYAGPSKVSRATELNLQMPNPGETDANYDQYKLVGLIQSLGLQAGRPQRQIGELGSLAKYLVSSRGQKSMTIDRIVTYKGTGLFAMYRYMYENTNPADRGKRFPAGQIWTFMNHPVFLNPVGLLFRFVNYSEEGEMFDIAHKYHEDVTISSVGIQMTEGDIGIADNMSISWSNTADYNL